jgi:hypothetical protein
MIGVSWCTITNKWVARQSIGGHQRCLGRFADEADAVRALGRLLPTPAGP